ncbi:acyltransferase family protein [Bifidobacteriaceae bacterium NR044]|nr:acyltransferase family protein [Bifidobacteriaceae bacterium NR043]MBF9353864.1 acyltransferase family protein [Bifidobacteriaceae bacterium NR044]
MTKKKRVNTSTVSPANRNFRQKEAEAANNASKTLVNKKLANESAKSTNTVSEVKNQIESKRNPAIDGLRALAIIGIVCFHMRPSTLSGGFLGVTLFLVLAGYFCTHSILRYLDSQKSAETSSSTSANTNGNISSNANSIEKSKTKTGEFKRLITCYFNYIWHRLKRIWPPTLGIIGVSAPIMWLFSPSLLPKLQADAFSGAGFFSNIMYVARKLSYFEQTGLPSPIKHLWYLGLIMQAFVVWPLILTALVKLVKRAITRMYITAGLAILSTILTFTFAYMFGDYTTPARVYYSLDTRASEFLLGAMLAMYRAWFTKHSLHAWIIRVFYWIRGNKHAIVKISTILPKSGITSSSSNETYAEKNTSNKQVDENAAKSPAENSIPEDLRAGLQIDLSDNAEILQDDYKNTDLEDSSKSEIHELPDNVFTAPKTVFYNPLHAWQRSLIGIATTIVLILCFVYADGTSSAFTFGGYTITAAVCALILWSCTQTDNICSRIFAFAPLSYLGKRAFAIYLVHFPILELCNPATRTTTVSWEEQILQAVIIVAVAECFYQLFEKQTEKYLQKLVHFVALAIACVITIFLIALPLNWNSIAQQRAIQIRPELTVNAAKNAEAEKTKTNKKANASASNKKTKGLHKSVVKQALPPKPSKYPVLFPIAEKVPQNLSASHTRIDKKHNTCSVNLTMVGDSITEGAKPYLLQVMPNAYIDGKVSRQIFHGADEYAQDISSKHAGDVVIYALGTNGPPHDDSVLQHMVDVAKGKPVYFVTTRVPQPWQDVTNDRLRKFAQTHPNVGIIDWNGFSKDHSEYLTDDGVHLTPVGGPKYAKMIRLALCGA